MPMKLLKHDMALRRSASEPYPTTAEVWSEILPMAAVRRELRHPLSYCAGWLRLHWKMAVLSLGSWLVYGYVTSLWMAR
jgi:hypothetical protein